MTQHPNIHPQAGAYSNAPQVAAALTNVGLRAGVKSVKLTCHYAMLLETKVKANASGRPGPRVITGDYRRSWTTDIVATPDGVTATVGTNRPQGRRLEFGFVGADRIGRVYNQPPFPHLGPAVDEIEPQYIESMNELGEWD